MMGILGYIADKLPKFDGRIEAVEIRRDFSQNRVCVVHANGMELPFHEVFFDKVVQEFQRGRYISITLFPLFRVRVYDRD
mgnify:CR=1 FL=1